ncbi:MAG: PilZ domain-containing protein [Planctomycetota bacterium]
MNDEAAKITLRDLQVSYDGETLEICDVRTPHHSVTLDAASVGELIEFVRRIEIESRLSDEPNRRESFRVPVLPSMELRCEVSTRGYRFEGKATNISMTGVYVEKQRTDPVELQLGDRAQVRLSCDGDTISLQAQVRRLGHSGYGLFFPITLKGSVIDPPPELRRIVMELQRRWMAFRSDVV